MAASSVPAFAVLAADWQAAEVIGWVWVVVKIAGIVALAAVALIEARNLRRRLIARRDGLEPPCSPADAQADEAAAAQQEARELKERLRSRREDDTRRKDGGDPEGEGGESR
jgi:flagellar biosynthesis/type III secretory pathway M-ring protein FliF/YscJ